MISEIEIKVDDPPGRMMQTEVGLDADQFLCL